MRKRDVLKEVQKIIKKIGDNRQFVIQVRALVGGPHGNIETLRGIYLRIDDEYLAIERDKNERDIPTADIVPDSMKRLRDVDLLDILLRKEEGIEEIYAEVGRGRESVIKKIEEARKI